MLNTELTGWTLKDFIYIGTIWRGHTLTSKKKNNNNKNLRTSLPESYKLRIKTWAASIYSDLAQDSYCRMLSFTRKVYVSETMLYWLVAHLFFFRSSKKFLTYTFENSVRCTKVLRINHSKSVQHDNRYVSKLFAFQTNNKLGPVIWDISASKCGVQYQLFVQWRQ